MRRVHSIAREVLGRSCYTIRRWKAQDEAEKESRGILCSARVTHLRREKCFFFNRPRVAKGSLPRQVWRPKTHYRVWACRGVSRATRCGRWGYLYDLYRARERRFLGRFIFREVFGVPSPVARRYLSAAEAASEAASVCRLSSPPLTPAVGAAGAKDSIVHLGAGFVAVAFRWPNDEHDLLEEVEEVG